MAWTHFTAYLDGTRPILKAERDELYDQLEAKFAAACPSQYSLHAANQAAIKASALLTDLASCSDEVALIDSTSSLYAIVAGFAPGAFTSVAAAQANALADAGISDTDLSAIRTSKFDSFQLWNFYKRFIDYLEPISVVPVITSARWRCCTPFTSFSYTITADNSPTSFGATSLPAGLSIDTATGVISGTPTATAGGSFNIFAYNACGSDWATVYLQLDAQISTFSGSGSNSPGGPDGPTSCIDHTYDVSDKFTCAQYVTITSGGSQTDWRLRVYANSSAIYDSFCISFDVDPYIATVLVPAGTTSMRVIGTCGCDGGSTTLMIYWISR